MLESHPGVAADAVAALTAAGYTVVRCDSADRSLPCRGMAADERCPLEDPVDVAVLAREPGTEPLEHGAVCAARDRVPILELVGPTSIPSPVATTVVAFGDDIVATCERAASDGRPHADAVCRTLVRLGVVTADEVGPERAVDVSVVRAPQRLEMTISLEASVARLEGEIVRAAGQALREFDRRVAVIDVRVRHTVAPGGGSLLGSA